MRILIITSEWPSKSHPEAVPFLVNEVNQLKRFGIHVDLFSFSGMKNPLNYLKAWFDLRKTFNLQDYDILHAEWGQSGLLALPKSRPLVVTFRGSDLEGIVDEAGRYTFSGRILRLISRFISSVADQVILVSESLSKFIPSIPYTVLPVCLDVDTFKPIDRKIAREQLNLPPEKKLVLFPCNPDRPEKRFFLAKEAVSLLGNDVDLIITRDVPHPKMTLYYNACDAMVITSSHEGSPTVVFEALACNLPIVSVDVGDVRQRIGNIKGCYVCKEDSPEKISHYLARALENPSRIDGFAQVLECDSANFCKKMKIIYESCL